MNGHQVEVRARAHLAGSALPEGDHRHLPLEVAPKADGLGQGNGCQGLYAGVRQAGKAMPRGLGACGSTHHLDANAEGLLPVLAADGIHG